jgi:hypothetical protein
MGTREFINVKSHLAVRGDRPVYARIDAGMAFGVVNTPGTAS